MNTSVALGPAVDWANTFDPNQPGSTASSADSSAGSSSDASSPSTPNSWLPAFPSDLFYPSVRPCPIFGFFIPFSLYSRSILDLSASI